MSAMQVRILQDEIMDQPGLDERLHAQALVGLGRVNWWSRTGSVLWNGLENLVVWPKSEPLRILDLASGGGDVACGLALQAARMQRDVVIYGCDRSETAIEFARDRARRLGLKNIHFFIADVLNSDFGSKYDVVTSTLFLHHLDQRQALQLLDQMSSTCTQGFLLDDLCRSRLGYLLAWLGCRLLTRSAMVHVDGPLSVQAAFSISEVKQLSEATGLDGVTFQKHWPERFLMSWKRPQFPQTVSPSSAPVDLAIES